MPFDPSTATEFDPSSATEVSTGFDPASATEVPSVQKPKPVGGLANIPGVAEPLLQMATGLAAKPVAEVAGIAAMFSDYLGKKDGDPLGFKRHVQEALTYSPRTAAGQSEYNPLNAIPTAVGKAVGTVTEPTMEFLRGDSSADSARGMAVNALGEAVPQALGILGVKGAPKVAARVGSVVDTVNDNRQWAQRAAAAKASNADWQRAAAIDAAKTARQNNIVMNPALVNPSAANKARMAATGGSDVFDTAASIANKKRWNDMARKDLGVGENVPLNESTYKAALKRAAVPYEKVSELGKLTPSGSILDDLAKIEVPDILPAGEASAGKVMRMTDQIIGKVSDGMTGSEALKTIKDLYREAKSIDSAVKAGQNVGTVALDRRDALRAMAKKMEELVEVNIPEPAWRKSFSQSRQKMAQIYSLRDATNLATNQIDPMVFAKEMERSAFLTGAAKEMGQIAANFPEIANIYAKTGMTLKMPVRSGPAGTAGYAAGSAFGQAVPISALSAGVSSLGGKLYAKRLMRDEVQRKLTTPVDRRIYEAAGASPTLQLGMEGYVPPTPFTETLRKDTNWTYGKPEAPKPSAPQYPEYPKLSAPSAESTMESLRKERSRAAGVERTIRSEAESAAESAAAASRKPASREVLFDLDPTTGKLVPASQGMKGATPEIWQADTGASLKSASEKVASGQTFAMTAAEKVAWSKTAVDLKTVAPEFAKLSEKQILSKMQDRQWVQDALSKARQKAEMYARIEQQSQDRMAQSIARVNREKMMDIAEQLQDALGSRPSSRGYSQGPKTRAFQRGLLTGMEE